MSEEPKMSNLETVVRSAIVAFHKYRNETTVEEWRIFADASLALLQSTLEQAGLPQVTFTSEPSKETPA